jgi:hypothetical protein
MEQTEERTGVSRRKVVVGVAWTVPAIIAASALPAYAASTTFVTASVLSVTDPAAAPVITFKLITNDGKDVKADTSATFSVTLTLSNQNQSVDPTPGTTTGLTVSDPPAASANRNFTVTVTVTADVGSGSTATLTINGFLTQSTVSAVATGATAAAGNSPAQIDATSKSYTSP